MQTNGQLACEADSSRMFDEFSASSRVQREELAYLRSAAKSNLTILITGESGTGKELVACAVHQLSHRSPRAFVRINCAAIPSSLLAGDSANVKADGSPRRNPASTASRWPKGERFFGKVWTIWPPRRSSDF